MEEILLIGCGAAGQRFARSVLHLEKNAPFLLKLIGIVEKKKEKASAYDCPIYGSYAEALSERIPSSIIIAANEENHYEILKETPDSIRKIICEKPLTETLGQVLNLRSSLENKFLNVNFVERYSPIIIDYFDWKSNNPGLVPCRVEFFWGKDRIADSRATIGVLSEMCHPIDLVDYIVGFDEWAIEGLTASQSNFHDFNSRILDSIYLTLKTKEYYIFGSSSFVWDSRYRKIIIFFRSQNKKFFKVSFEFDSPHWDCDTLSVILYNEVTGQKETIHQKSYTAADFNPEVRFINKINTFLSKSFAATAVEKLFPEQVAYAQALKIQRILEDINNHIKSQASIPFTDYGIQKSFEVAYNLQVEGDHY